MNKLNRYIIKKNNELMAEVPTKLEAAKQIGCSLDWIYKSTDDEGNLTFQNNNYQLIDKLSLIG